MRGTAAPRHDQRHQNGKPKAPTALCCPHSTKDASRPYPPAASVPIQPAAAVTDRRR
jgi:hypothetical protein